MKPLILSLLAAFLALPAEAQPARTPIPPPAALAAWAPGSVWSINLVGLKGEALGNFTIQLLAESGDWSCGGPERKARLIQSSIRSIALAREFETKGYFPTYRADGARMTIQLTHVCDYGLYLSGTFTGREGKGDYVESSRGHGKTLGTFTAKRRQQ